MPVTIPPGFARSPGRHRTRNFKQVDIVLATIQDQIDVLALKSEELRGTPVQDLTALKAISPEDRADKRDRLVEDEGAIYHFDQQSSAVADGDLVVAPDSGTGRWLKLAAGSMGSVIKTDAFTPTLGQTVFALSFPYAGSGDPVWLTVGGIAFELGVDYTLVGTTLTWLDVDFTLDATDRIVIIYAI